MKRLLSVLLTAVMLFCMIGPAFAAEADLPLVEPPPVEDEQPPAAETISTLDELKAALATANDGDTLTISRTIFVIDESLITDKKITISLDDDFTNINGVLEMRGEAVVEGFTFSDGYNTVITIRESEATIRNCTFTASGEVTHISILGGGVGNTARIENCCFKNAGNGAIDNKHNTNTIIDDCIILNNQSGAIYNSGTLTLSNTLISENTALSGGGVYNSIDGTLTLSNCNIYANTTTNDFGNDILSLGELSINGRVQEGEGFYNEDTGEKLSLPLTDCASTTKLIYLSDDEAAKRFASNLPDTDEPKEDEQPPVENQPADNQPIENPPLDNTPTEEDKPATDKQPAETDNKQSNEGPSIIYVPVYIPSNPTTSTSTTTTTKPETKPATVTSAPVFACGNAVIDVTRSVVLEGYGDGLLHLEDSLTRAQMATIIYRLLDTDTLAKYDRATSNFTDVSPTAWYSRYVSTIANAGIVSGVGNGCYNPEGKLTWAHILTVLCRFTELKAYTLKNIQYSGWALQSVQTAVALGWIGDYANFNPDAVITRGEFQQLVNGVLGLYRTI